MAELRELHAALKSMMNVIATGAGTSTDGETLTDLLHRIDGISAELDDSCPPMLQHYLEKRSYAKAVDFLESRDENGTPNC